MISHQVKSENPGAVNSAAGQLYPGKTGPVAAVRDAPEPVVQVPEVTLVMPIFNQGRLLRECLEAVTANTADELYEGVIVDTASTEAETLELLRALTGEVRIIRHSEKLGFAEACNRGAAYARGKYLVFLPPDTLPQPGWLQSLIAVLAADPQAGAAGAKVTDGTGRDLEAGAQVGALLVRRDLFEKLGGFNLRFAPVQYLEFGLRALGYIIRYCPEAVMIYQKPPTPGIAWETLSRVRPAEKHLFSGWAQDPAYAAALAGYTENPLVLLELSSRCNFHCDYCRSPT
ncbi:MAG: glycosyltransferase family 2 protein, partial [Candidatus Firestonebacteria bacterium]|nr:glycosyltransferase family 2 protein [Candidatus Firestonebacteria bacterium]